MPTPAASQVLARFDALPAVAVADLAGRWRGRTVPSGHPMDGVLERLGWWGKVFQADGDARPLVFQGSRGLVEVDPRRIPLGVALRAPWLARVPLAPDTFHSLLPLLRTTVPRARLRPVEHRGVVTAAMVYDHQPVVDVFRAAGPDELLGLMDARGLAQPFFFSLRRTAHPGDARRPERSTAPVPSARFVS